MVNYDGLYNKNFYGDKLNEDHFSTQKLHFRIIENATVLPFKLIPETAGFGGIVDEKGNYIKTSFFNASAGDAYTPNEKVTEFLTPAIYLGMFADVWGHCLTDNLQRIWFLKSETYKKNFKKFPVVFTLRGGGQALINFTKLLKILDVDIDNFYPVAFPAKFKYIILPDGAFFWNEKISRRMFTAEYIETVDQLRNFAFNHRQPLSNKKFYFFHGNNQTGEERLAEYFYSKGYEIIQPEKFPIEDQLNIFANCENFASTIGSCSHNMIFMKDNLDAILIPRAGYLTGFQEALNEFHEPNICYIDSTLSIFADENKGFGPFCYIISENLRKHFGDKATEKYSDEDFLTFLEYVKQAKNKGLNENPDELKYLENIFPEFLAQIENHDELIKKIFHEVKE